MKEDYLKNWNLMSHEMQKSLQSMMELNARTLQSFKYLKPEDLSAMRQPGEILGKQMTLAMENSQQLLSYMHKSFEILEGVFLSFSQEMRDKAGQSFKQAQSMAETIQQQDKVVKARKKSPSKKSTATATEKRIKVASLSTKKSEKAETKKAVSLKKKADKTESKLSAPKKQIKTNKAKRAKTGSKLKTTVLEQKMGMAETKPNLLVSPLSEDKKADKTESKRENLNRL